MLPSERARITRRKRIAHLGVGGVILAAASVTVLERADDAAPAAVATPEPVAAGGHVLDPQERLRPHPHRASRSHPRTPHPAVKAAPAPATVPVGWPWPQLAQCESGGHWSEVTGNGFLWGLQFVASTWDANRGSLPTAGYYLARGTAPTPAEQIEVGKRIQAGAGWGAWPACSAELGLR